MKLNFMYSLQTIEAIITYCCTFRRLLEPNCETDHVLISQLSTAVTVSDDATFTATLSCKAL